MNATVTDGRAFAARITMGRATPNETREQTAADGIRHDHCTRVAAQSRSDGSFGQSSGLSNPRSVAVPSPSIATNSALAYSLFGARG